MAGADRIKICSSGGVASLTDKLETGQFTVPEIKAICDTVRMMASPHLTVFSALFFFFFFFQKCGMCTSRG